MRFTRRYSTAGKPAQEQVEWKTVTAEIPGAFRMEGVEVPARWSETATNVLAQKYLRKAGVPLVSLEDLAYQRWKLVRVAEAGVPGFLRRSEPAPDAALGGETSARQVFHRLAGCWTYWGWREGIFRQRDKHGNPLLWDHSDAEEQALIFYDELYLMLALQVGAPNSPQWFNTGLHWAYGIEGPSSGQWAIQHNVWDSSDHKDKFTIHNAVYQTQNSYERPQPHACFIQPVADDLVNPGGMMDLWTREARLFKHGSGSGSNVSSIRARGERLSGGGRSSGLMSFLEVGDRSAGSIQSGGTTRRAALMRVLDADHPEIADFINWKAREERKAFALALGSQELAQKDGGEVYSAEYEGEAIRTVSGQNSNNSVRVTDEFMELAEKGGEWQLKGRVDPSVNRTVDAIDLWDKICRAAHACADPGLQFHDTINAWHTCAADGEIRASNPCSEFMFLDSTACNLASLRLTAFLREDGSLDLEAYEHAVRLWTVVLEVSVYMASYPSREIAEINERYRTLGLGYTDLGGLLMRLALPYDSDEGRALAAGLTALLTGVAYRTSAELADELGPFEAWERNAEGMRRVLRNHARAGGMIDLNGFNGHDSSYEGLNVQPLELDEEAWIDVTRAVHHAWSKVLAATFFRNAQVTLLAPTGTIALVMDCDTTGVEPDFALVKRKQLAGGGEITIVNQAVEPALKRLGYDSHSRESILHHVKLFGSLDDCGDLKHHSVFACANELPWEAHVKMVAAVQPFLSGAVSKTINLPNKATVEDVSRAYRMAHQLGLKAVALYRDGSKLTQPLSVAIPSSNKNEDMATGESVKKVHKITEEQEAILRRSITKHHGKVEVIPNLDYPARGEREYLPWKRHGHTQKVKIGNEDSSVFLTVNTYPDGRPAETFLELGHQGSTLRAMADLWAMAISVGLQYGVPVGEYVDRFLHTKFEPAGVVEGHDRISMVSSIGDLVARHLALEYLGREELGQKVRYVAVEADERAVALDKRALALASTGYTGETCRTCHNATLKRAGSCLVCATCGETTGCG